MSQQGAELGRLLGGFDAFGDALQGQPGSEPDDGADDRGVRGVVDDIVDERLVDLDDVDRQQLAEVTQRGVADSEVVDGQQHAQLAEAGEHRARPADVGDDRRLGDLQAQPVRRQAGLGQRPAHGLQEVLGGQLARRDVDGDLDVIAPPAHRLRAGLADDPFADRLDQPQTLGHRDELVRRDRPQERMAPAQQRLDTGDLPAAQPDLRLVVEAQLAVGQRLAQAALQRQPAQRDRAQRVVEGLAARLAVLLGTVHRGVGVLHQLVGVVAVAGACDGQADRRGDEARLPVEIDRGSQRGGQAFGDAQRLGLPRDVGDQDGELVTAEAGDDVLGAQRGGQAARDGLQQAVAGAVAERVVDELEVVDVDEQDRDVADSARIARTTLQRVLDTLDERAAVGQAGQWIVCGAMSQRGLGARRGGAGQLVGAPGRDVDARHRGDERRVDGRPQPRLLRRGGVRTVDRRGVDRPHDAVVDQDVGDRQAPRDPVLVERQQRDDHEEVEVRLGDPAPEVREDRRAGDQAQRADRRAGARVQPPGGAGDRADQDRQRVEQDVGQRVAAGDGEDRQPDDVQPQEHQNGAVARLERGSRQRAAGRQPTARPADLAVRVRQHIPRIGRSAPIFGGPVRCWRTLILASWPALPCICDRRS
jgi:hypothetical protein